VVVLVLAQVDLVVTMGMVVLEPLIRVIVVEIPLHIVTHAEALAAAEQAEQEQTLVAVVATEELVVHQA
jgi:hypothetical protein